MFRLFSTSDNATAILSSRSIRKNRKVLVTNLNVNDQLISNLCIDPKVDRYMVGFEGGLVIIYEKEKVTKLNCDSQNISSITALTFIDENLIAAACNKQIHIFNIQTEQCIAKLTGHTADIWSMAVSSKGDLFSTSPDKTMRIWDIRQSTCKSVTRNYHGQAHYALTDFLVNICSYNPFLKNTLSYLTGYMLLAERDAWMSCLLPLSNGNIICGTQDAVIALLDENGCCKMEVKAGEKQKWSTGIDWCGVTHQHITGLVEHNNVVVSSSRDGTVRVWDKTSLQLKQKLHTPDYPNENKIQSIAVINNYIIAHSALKQNLYIWDMATWECKKIISGLSPRTQLAVTMNDEIILAGCSVSQYKLNNNIYILPLHTCLSASDNLDVTLDSLLNPSNDTQNVCTM